MSTQLIVKGQNDSGEPFEWAGLSIRRYLQYKLDGHEHTFEFPNARISSKSAEVRAALRALGGEVLHEYVRVELDDAKQV